ncbi:MAG: DUF547 domain-containing protein [Bacteroidota bacterium]
MKKFVLLCLMGIVSLQSHSATPAEFTAAADLFLKRYVVNGSVAYQKIALNFAEVENLYQQIGSMALDKVDRETRKAFYINAYNIIVIYWVAKHLPLKSPLDDSGFFDKVRHKVAGEALTLNALEIKKLLQDYKDARIHFALACAARSCPPLASFAYTAAGLDLQLTERTSLALNNKDWLRVDPAKKSVQLSKIFDWYKNDFTSSGKTQIDWINQYRKEKIPVDYTVVYYEYNWELNSN